MENILRKIEGNNGRGKIGEIESWYFEQARRKYPLEASWYQSIAFYLGFQWIVPHPTTLFLRRMDSERGKIRLVVNMIKPYVEDRISKYVRNRPRPRAIPNKQDSESLIASYKSERLIEFLWRKLNVDIELQDSLFWMLLCGKGFLKVYWNSSKGNDIHIPLTEYKLDEDGNIIQSPVLDEMGNPITQSFKEGEIEIRAVSPFSIYVDEEVKSLEEAPRIVEVSDKPVEEMKLLFPEYCDRLDSIAVTMPYNYFKNRLIAMKDPSLPHFSQVFKKLRTVTVKEVWDKPTIENPEGRHLIYLGSGDIILVDEPYPYRDRFFHPYVEFDDCLMPLRFWTPSVVNDLIPLQKELNKTRSQLIEVKNRIAKPKWVVAEESITSKEQFYDVSGEIVFYSASRLLGGPPPHIAPIPSLPNYFMDSLRMCYTDFEEVSNRHEISRGINPTYVSSAQQAAIIAERDETRLGPKIQRFHKQLNILAEKIISRARQFYIEPRRVEILYDDYNSFSPEVFEILGNELIDNVYFEIGSEFTKSRATQEQMSINLYQMGVFGSPGSIEARMNLLKKLSVTNVAEAFENVYSDLIYVDDENKKMIMGNQVQVEDWHNHYVHFDKHSLFMKNKQFENLDEGIKNNFRNHISAHINFIINPNALMEYQMAKMRQPQVDRRKTELREQNIEQGEHIDTERIAQIPMEKVERMGL